MISRRKCCINGWLLEIQSVENVVSTLSINVALESVVNLYLLDCCEKSAPSGTLCHAKGSHFINVLSAK